MKLKLVSLALVCVAILTIFTSCAEKPQSNPTNASKPDTSRTTSSSTPLIVEQNPVTQPPEKPILTAEQAFWYYVENAHTNFNSVGIKQNLMYITPEQKTIDIPIEDSPQAAYYVPIFKEWAEQYEFTAETTEKGAMKAFDE